MSTLALVFGGGNAVAAYDAGAFEAVAAAGHEPDHIAGSSAGAMTAALVAGNPPERRVAALRAFWEEASSPGQDSPWLPAEWLRLGRLAQGLGGKLLGRPALFRPRLEQWLDPAAPPGLQDTTPAKATLSRLIDFDRINTGKMRVSLLAVDLLTGEEVVFDNRAAPIGIDHILASSALLPDFPPVSIGGRMLVDGGLAANTPVHLVLDPARDGLVCFAVDPFPLQAAAPKRMLDAQERQTDLIFALQTRSALTAHAARWAADPALHGEVWRIEYRAGEDETALKSYDFGRPVLDRRWEAGRRDMAAALAAWGGQEPCAPGLVVHDRARTS